MKAVNNIRVMMMAVLLALGAMQATAVTYKNSYRPSNQQQTSVNQNMSATQVALPTSVATQFNSDNGVKTLNADGTVNEEAYGIGKSNAPGPRRNPTNPVVDEENSNTPIGDGLLPLLLCALAYMGVTAIRRRKTTATR